MNNGNGVTNDLAKRIQSLQAERTKLKKELEQLQKDAEQRNALKNEKAKKQTIFTPAFQLSQANIKEQPFVRMPKSLCGIIEETKKKSNLYIQSENEGKRIVVQMDNALNKVIIEELENLLRENDRRSET